jgi:hypothetical protein
MNKSYSPVNHKSCKGKDLKESYGLAMPILFWAAFERCFGCSFAKKTAYAVGNIIYTFCSKQL